MQTINTAETAEFYELDRKLTQCLNEWALLLVAGRLTGEHLRSRVGNSRLKLLVNDGYFAKVMKVACDKVRPQVSREPSLLLELDAVERKLRRLINAS